MLNLIFLGTFNPPHRGHLECLRAALANREKYGYYIRFKDIYMIPAWQNPNKSTTTVSHKQRCAMCSEMIRDAEHQDYWHFGGSPVTVSEIEDFLRPKYTVELIKFLKENDTPIGKNFWWLITDETYNELKNHRWVESNWLLENNKFLIVTDDENYNSTHNAIYIPFAEDAFTDIHSTQIRNHYAQFDTKHKEISMSVDSYIRKHKLYKEEKKTDTSKKKI